MLDRSTKKQLGYDTRPGHKGRTLAGKILSVKGLYDQAVEVLKSSLSQGDLKAAIFAIEQVDGKAKQKVDVTTNGKELKSAPAIIVSSEVASDIQSAIDRNNAAHP